MKYFTPDRLLLYAAALYFTIFGGMRAWNWSYDFLTVYCGTKCVLNGCNPYDANALEQQYTLSGGSNPYIHTKDWRYGQPPVYPPSTFVALIPIGLLGLPAAQDLWFCLNAALMLVAVWFVLSSYRGPHPWMANLLAAFFLYNSLVLLVWGQPACFAISLLIISCTLYRRGQHRILATCLLCLSLAVKPQIGALIALYLLLDKANRRYVAAAIAGSVAILLIGAATLQHNPQSKTWLADMRSNIADTLLPGHINDPASPTGWEVNVEPAVTAVSPGATVTKAVTYTILAILFGLWSMGAARVTPELRSNILLFGTIVAFSMLPIYHRRTDTSLLLLTIPSLLFIFARRRILGLVMAALTILASSPIQSMINAWLMTHHPAIRLQILANKLLVLLILRQENIAMLLLVCLYLVAIFTIRIQDGSASGDNLGYRVALEAQSGMAT